MNRNRHDSTEARDTLAALIAPSSSTVQRSGARKETHAAMLAEFSRAAAPQREPRVDGDAPAPTESPVAAGGWLMSSVDRIDDPAAAAAAMDDIVAKHRARTR